MIDIKEKVKCCGCNACVQICPKHCIVMQEDEEGFLYPKVNTDECINCNLCEKVCPIINQNEPCQPLKVFAAKNSNKVKRTQSSSGGLFIALAEQIIKQDGVVFGACFDSNWEIEHQFTETLDGLFPLMRSKYVQSRIGNTFKEAEQFLKQEKMVLYVGTSCQIAGLKRFLRKNYENLITVDFICHGVPSPKVWRKYLREEFEEQSMLCLSAEKNTILSSSLNSISSIKDINFRAKSYNGYDWEKSGFVIFGKSVNKNQHNSVLSSYKHNENPFMKGFLANIYLRPSCYHCPAKSGRSGADITLADFWGIQKIDPSFYDKAGVGCAIINSTKGQTLFNTIDAEIIDSNLEAVTNNNYLYYRSVSMPKCRDFFFKLLNSEHTVKECVNRCLHKPKILRIYSKIHLKLKRILKLAK